MADALDKAETAVLEANAIDVARAEAAGTSPALIDRLRLNPDRIAGMAEGLRELAALPDPVGDVVRGWTNANGVQVRAGAGAVRRGRHHLRGAAERDRRRGRHLPQVGQRRAAARLLVGGRLQRRRSSRRCRPGWPTPGCRPTRSSWCPGRREVTAELMAARGLVDVLIPRGGAGLIETVVRDSQVPVIETGVGNCHLYVDASADEQMALDDPAQREGAAALGLQRGRDPAGARRPARRPSCRGRCGRWSEAGVTVHGDARVDRVRRPVVPARRPTSPTSTCRWTSRRRSSTRWTERCTTSAATAPGTARRS